MSMFKPTTPPGQNKKKQPSPNPSLAATLALAPGALNMQPGGTAVAAVHAYNYFGQEVALPPDLTIDNVDPSIVSFVRVTSTVTVTALPTTGQGALIARSHDLGILSNTLSVVNAAVVTPPDTTPASITIAPTGATLVTGDSRQFTATVRNAGGDILLGVAVTFQSSNGAAATIGAGTGSLTTVAPGTTDITAFVTALPSVMSAPATVLVQAASLTSVPLALRTLDGSTGPALVSCAIPLPRGMLAPGASASVRLFIAGVEQAIYVQELTAKHSDGSLRSIYIQCLATLSPTIITGELRIGGTRGTTDIADTGANRGVPQALALPTSVTYLLSCDLVGPTLSYAAQVALGGPFAGYEANFFTHDVVDGARHWVGFGEFQWEAGGDQWTYDYYDRALIWFAQWVRTGDTKYWERGVRQAYRYREDYLRPGVETYGGVQPYQQQIEGVQLHYVLTGDPVSKATVIGQTTICHVFWAHFNDIDPTLNNAYIDDRSHARVIQAFLCAWRLDPTGSTPNDSAHDPGAPETFVSILNQVATKCLTNQDPVTGRDITMGTTQINYMQGMVCDSLLKVWHWYSHLAGIQQYVEKTCAYLWTQWNAGARGFAYANEAYSGPGGAGDQTPEPDLNMLMVNAFAFAFALTANTTYRDRGDAAFSGGVDLAYLWPLKAFNENYWSAYQYAAVRGGAL